MYTCTLIVKPHQPQLPELNCHFLIFMFSWKGFIYCIWTYICLFIYISVVFLCLSVYLSTCLCIFSIEIEASLTVDVTVDRGEDFIAKKYTCPVTRKVYFSSIPSPKTSNHFVGITQFLNYMVRVALSSCLLLIYFYYY